MKLCIDCKWMSGNSCIAPQNYKTINPVDGEKIPNWYCCKTHRTGCLTGWIDCRIFGLCGKSGRWFQPKDKNDLFKKMMAHENK